MNIFITGGTKGIGNGLVRHFQELGHQIVYTGTSEDSIEKSGHNQLTGTYGVVCDVRHRIEIENALNFAVKTLKTIDIVINNAGVNQKNKPVIELEEEDISNVIDVNVKGMINATSEALRIMKKQGYGRIYNMEGLGSNNMVFPKTVIYASSKHLLSFFTKGVKKELKDYPNIKVGTLSPGMVYTDFLKSSEGFENNFVMKALGNPVDKVTPFLVNKILKGKMKINYLTFSKTMWRFMSFPFRKKTRYQ
ncbi:SDR family oxidoreductase [Mariniplasma anaerobium]|uniref:Putative beta-ketoacyl-ACP reductase n=1 Tax=Mariniplasma anaerobium TaxID=2735436 RepID=A0A7U9THM7_9MOLU|nr:SDR family oxidoreductase [Mariniplasma anaerobium]BCR35229.1 putative beta-ketoacyl-ACP reductase [Mariniplasma anaerobium]